MAKHEISLVRGEYVIVATGPQGTSAHLVIANRAPNADEAREIALRTGAMVEDTIEVRCVCCVETHLFPCEETGGRHIVLNTN